MLVSLALLLFLIFVSPGHQILWYWDTFCPRSAHQPTPDKHERPAGERFLKQLCVLTYLVSLYFTREIFSPFDGIGCRILIVAVAKWWIVSRLDRALFLCFSYRHWLIEMFKPKYILYFFFSTLSFSACILNIQCYLALIHVCAVYTFVLAVIFTVIVLFLRHYFNSFWHSLATWNFLDFNKIPCLVIARMKRTKGCSFPQAFQLQ